MDLLTLFKRNQRTVTALEAAELFGMNVLDFHDECTDKTMVHLYGDDSFYIVELASDRFYTIIERSEYTTKSLSELETVVYIPAQWMMDYAEKYIDSSRVNYADLTTEYEAFCTRFSYKPMSADELLYEIRGGFYTDTAGDKLHWHSVYLQDYIERWDSV